MGVSPESCYVWLSTSVSVVILIQQQVAMEKFLIGSQTESTITRCPKKGRGSSERLAAAISGRVVTVAALAKAGARRAGMQIRL